jgi:hypothetical protein
MIVNENIIRNALNESIDEFLLEEGAFDGLKNWWNKSANGQKVKNGLSNVWNGVKNGVAMYMDSQTDGQWNNKYGIYANGNGKTTELYYLNKWFNTHLENIRKIEYRNNTPDADFSKSREYVERNGEKVYTDTEIQYDDIKKYVQNNVTPNNFNNWIGNFIKDRQALELIDNYILECQRSVNDLQSAMKWLNTGSFLADANTGQIYIKTRNSELVSQRQQYFDKQETDRQKAEQERQEQYKQQQQQILNDAYTMIDAWSKYIASIKAYKNGLIRTKTGPIHWTNSVLGALSNTNGMPNEIKQWMDSVIAYNIYDSPKNVAQKITYGEFINSKYGEKYKKIDEWLKKQK